MYPDLVYLFGVEISIWNLTFLVGAVLGYGVLILTFRLGNEHERPRLLWLRYLATVYVSVLGAQLFAYLFDLHTSLLPEGTRGWASYYLDPFAGPKTLYGAILFLPVAVLAISSPWGDLRYDEASDRWTPALLVVLGVSRLGCFLQGCCYGAASSAFGLAFSVGSPTYYDQLGKGLISAGSTTLPVIPTQGISAFALLALSGWTLRRLHQGHRGLLPGAIAAYSLFRFAIEFVRADPERNFYGILSTSQWIALLILASYGLWKLVFQQKTVDSPQPGCLQ
jgi:prolipoprotein diacylglyceryltransferase